MCLKGGKWCIVMKKQVFNPYLPLSEYVPDGEPHIFNDRVYVYGSHDEENGKSFCPLDYVCYSAPVTDLSDWKYEGIIYKRTDDPMNEDGSHALYAPDVCEGADGRYYLYYSLDFLNLIAVAVCDTPAGKYKFHGMVQYPEGNLLTENMPFDPAIMNDNGRIYLYYGFAPTIHKIPGLPDNLHMPGCSVVELENDMITVKSNPKQVIPSTLYSKDTGFEGHEYFEAPSIRKINDIYYLVYSSILSHELCYCVSNYPDQEFKYQGTIISNGDVGLNGRGSNEKVAAIGNNHGGLVCADKQWYIFYHRHTHTNAFSRQGCAEPVTIDENGLIKQVEVTSCGLNRNPLDKEGEYPAIICCNLTNGNMPNHTEETPLEPFPHITNDGEERYITDITDGTLIGYKYFELSKMKALTIKYRGDGNGRIVISGDGDDDIFAVVEIEHNQNWVEVTADIDVAEGKQPLYLTYQGEGAIDILTIRLCAKD